MAESRWRIWYDDQCEVCQAGLAWLRCLDREHIVDAIALSSPAPPPHGATSEDLLRLLHAQAPDGRVFIGAEAVAALAKLFRPTGWIGRFAMLPGVRALSRAAYGWIARHRYELSRCRGGACRSTRIDFVRERAAWRTFQACRVLGWSGVAPLAGALFVRRLARQTKTWWSTRGRAVTLLEGRLSLHFLGGGVSWTVPLLFGELFTMLRYRRLVVDPGGTRMRRSVRRHLARLPAEAQPLGVLATHAHEEHCGNLDLVAQRFGARVHATSRELPLLLQPPRIPAMRAIVIGQPKALRAPVDIAGSRLRAGPEPEDELWILETPGHCSEHMSLYAPADRLLLLGDGFMGTHFSTPNDDVDHRAWIASLERLLDLEIEIAVEAHGHVHTTRADVLRDLEAAGLSCIASRRDPKALLCEKLEFLRWVDSQIAAGASEGLPPAAIQATVFPWTQRWSYESVLQDRLASALSSRAFGRHVVVRSFREPVGESGAKLPSVFELVCFRASDSERHRDVVQGTSKLAPPAGTSTEPTASPALPTKR